MHCATAYSELIVTSLGVSLFLISNNGTNCY